MLKITDDDAHNCLVLEPSGPLTRRDLDALTERGAKLPKIDLAPPKGVIGKSTVEAIRSGVIYGYAAAVDGIIARLQGELGEEADVIATGGLATHIVPFTDRIDEIDDLLTLTGLRLLHERNAS